MPETIRCLQAGRAIAALMVVFHHAGLRTEAFVGGIPEWLRAILDRGYLGVDFFFVLSGFIIYYSTAGDRKKGFRFGSYAWKRISRVFIPYWPIGLGLAIAFTLMPGLSDGDRAWSWFASVTLLPSFGPPALSVAWTLQHELIFYFLFAIFVSLGSVRIGMAVWAVAILTAWATGIASERPLSILLSPINLEFLFGVIAARAFMKGATLPKGSMAAGMLIPLILFAALGFEREHSPLVGLSLAFLLLVICRLEASGRLKVGAILLLLGNASYAIYLIHNPLLSLTSRIAASQVWLDSWPAAISLGVLAATFSGVAYHLVYEQRTLALTRKRAKTNKTTSHSVAPEAAKAP